jgi:hypothetical protein
VEQQGPPRGLLAEFLEGIDPPDTAEMAAALPAIRAAHDDYAFNQLISFV